MCRSNEFQRFGERGSSAFDHHAASQSDRYRRSNGDLLGVSFGHGSAQLSVEEERNGHYWRNVFELYDPG
jgi:hypothetical protein